MTEKLLEIVVGMLGWSQNVITKDTEGYCLFPVGAPDSRYRGGRTWERVKVTAIEDVPAMVDVVAVDDKGHIKPYVQLVEVV